MDPDETRRPGPGLSPPRSRWHRARSAWLRAATVLALALGLGLVSPVLTPGAAHAADDWIVGGTKYSTILNCPSVVQGFPYSEPGIAATSGYFGTPGTSPTVGQTTYYAMQAVRLGSHCSTPLISPRFVLPSGVAFDKTQPINCLYTPPGPGQTIQVTNAQECPQWSNVAADGTYSSAKSGWSSGWPLPSATGWVNGSAWEFQVPVKASTTQAGSTLLTNLKVIDGVDNPTLQPQVQFYASGSSTVTVPGTPTGVAASATSTTTARVSFAAPASNGGASITAYGAQCESTNGGTTRTATSTGSPVTVTALTPGKAYRCQVRAQNSKGWSAWSAYSATFGTPAAATVPGAPSNVVLTEVGPTQLRATFTPPASNGGSAITSYYVQCWQQGITDVPAGNAEGPGTSHTVSDLLPGRRYSCRVSATNQVGAGPFSPSSAYLALGAVVPGAPTGITASATSATTARVTFLAPANNGGDTITAYSTQCVSTDGGTTRTATSTGSPATVTALTPDKQYHCQVRAQNSKGWGAWSTNSAIFRTPAAPTDPTDPTTPTDRTPPETRIVPTRLYDVFGPSIRFSSPSADRAGYHCRVDFGRWFACRSGYVPPWRAGSHVVQVRAVDKSGNVDPTPAVSVWNSPLNDRSLHRKRKWTASRNKAFYRGTAFTTTRRGATLSTGNVRAKGIAIVATKCPKCGTVDVFYGKQRIGRVSLKSSRTQVRQVINLRSWSTLQSPKQIRIKVVTKRKQVSIEGLGIRTR